MADVGKLDLGKVLNDAVSTARRASELGEDGIAELLDYYTAVFEKGKAVKAKNVAVFRDLVEQSYYCLARDLAYFKDGNFSKHLGNLLVAKPSEFDGMVGVLFEGA